MVDKKNLFEGRATTQTKNGFFFLKRYFLFVSWPSLQKTILLGKPSFSTGHCPFSQKRGSVVPLPSKILFETKKAFFFLSGAENKKMGG